MLKVKEVEFTTKTKSLVDRISVLRSKLTDIEAEVKTADDNRAHVATTVDVQLLRQYDVVRRKRLPAMVAVNGGTCSGCRMNIPAQRFNSLVASRGIDTCPSCTRIIYAAEALEVQTAK